MHHANLVPLLHTQLILFREDQLYYEILISGKAFPLNGTIPIAFKFTPLAKVRLHRIKIFVSENVEYYCNDKKVHRLEAKRKILLFEKQAEKSGEVSSQGVVGREPSFMSSGISGVGVSGPRTFSPQIVAPTRPGGAISRIGRPSISRYPTIKDDPSAPSLLGDLEGGDASGVGTEFEVNVPLPGCQVVRIPVDIRNKNSPLIPMRFHHATIWPNILVHHWIKVVLRVSKADENAENKSKRRHFEISIDAPIRLLSVFPRMSCANFSAVLKPIHIFLHIIVPRQPHFQDQI